VNFDAPGYHVHGSFLVSQFAAADGTLLHYDEALAELGIGEFSVWKVASWVEAVR
jgi:pyruvoyl-dependent arginine decarboxylase (PvlArgDC)